MFAVAPFVLLVDRDRLDGRPVPRRWADLMDPIYRDQVVFSGWCREGERRYRQVNTFFLLFMALAYPLWLTVKTAHAARLAMLARYFHGPDLADYLDHNRYPALCPGREPAVPPGARLTWPGWEVIRDPATSRTLRAVRRCFLERESQLWG